MVVEDGSRGNHARERRCALRRLLARLDNIDGRYAQWPCDEARQGRFDDAFVEMDAGDWTHIDDRPLLANLRDRVASLMCERAGMSAKAAHQGRVRPTAPITRS